VLTIASAKLQAVTTLLAKLKEDLDKIIMLPHRQHVVSMSSEMEADAKDAERDAALEELKVYGRDPLNADPIFTKDVRLPIVSAIKWPRTHLG
jgi:hypothetical protein